MEVVKHEIEAETYFGRCKCCLEYGYMKNIWSEHSFEGESEIYGEMLRETFLITSDKPGKEEHICESCISRLRDAYCFKKEVLASIEILRRYEENEFEVPILTKAEMSDQQLSDEEVEYLEDAALGDIVEEYKEPEYQDIEYLEEDEAVVAAEITRSTAEAPINKGPKKKRKGHPNIFKQYTETDLRTAVEAVLNKLMTPNEAAKMYNVPRRTISARATYMKSKQDTPENEQRKQFLLKQYRFTDEIKTILTYTNAMPFKVRKTRCICAYCDPSPLFESLEDIRIHTVACHDDRKIKDLDNVLKPKWLNEILRLDVENLACNECSTGIPTWNDMFQHLKDHHNVELDEAYTRVIPYKLTNDHKCALCSEKFPHFHFLDAHMNAHYNNYVCPECGDTYVSEGRFKKHLMIHSNDRFPCQECGKVFSLKKYRTKHINYVHKHEKLFKCLYCESKFTGEYERHLHVLEVHNEKVNMITCEFCGKFFTWRPYFLAHMRKKHHAKRHKCHYCSKKFIAQYELRKHIMRHNGQGDYECDLCAKRLVTKAELKIHMRVHNKNNLKILVLDDRKE